MKLGQRGGWDGSFKVQHVLVRAPTTGRFRINYVTAAQVQACLQQLESWTALYRRIERLHIEVTGRSSETRPASAAAAPFRDYGAPIVLKSQINGKLSSVSIKLQLLNEPFVSAHLDNLACQLQVTESDEARAMLSLRGLSIDGTGLKLRRASPAAPVNFAHTSEGRGGPAGEPRSSRTSQAGGGSRATGGADLKSPARIRKSVSRSRSLSPLRGAATRMNARASAREAEEAAEASRLELLAKAERLRREARILAHTCTRQHMQIDRFVEALREASTPDDEAERPPERAGPHKSVERLVSEPLSSSVASLQCHVADMQSWMRDASCLHHAPPWLANGDCPCRHRLSVDALRERQQQRRQKGYTQQQRLAAAQRSGGAGGGGGGTDWATFLHEAVQSSVLVVEVQVLIPTGDSSSTPSGSSSREEGNIVGGLPEEVSRAWAGRIHLNAVEVRGRSSPLYETAPSPLTPNVPRHVRLSCTCRLCSACSTSSTNQSACISTRASCRPSTPTPCPSPW